MANFDMPGYDFDRTESRTAADWDTLARMREAWPQKLVVKGVLDIEDAIQLKNAGVDAIQVSSHGARQLESAPAAFDMLRLIRKLLVPKCQYFLTAVYALVRMPSRR
jgi:(S)-mandelate dehydrogenase